VPTEKYLLALQLQVFEGQAVKNSIKKNHFLFAPVYFSSSSDSEKVYFLAKKNIWNINI
jgi:hypothetical protein